MSLPFQQHDACAVILLQENTDPNGKHLEYKDAKGAVFAQMAKVYKRKGLFGLFPADANVHGELKDAAGTLLLTTTSYRGDTAPECKVEVNLPDGSLVYTLIDAPWGVDFALPNGELIGRMRRPEGATKTEPKKVVYQCSNAEGHIVGTCDRRFPNQNDSLLDFLTGTTLWGMPVQWVTATEPIDPVLHLALFLFPSLQHLRFSRNW